MQHGWLVFLVAACGGKESEPSEVRNPAETEETTESSPESKGLRVVTWNTGTTPGLPHDAEPDDGYGSEQAAVSDEHYGDGLAWIPAIDAASMWLEETDPDVVVFQEMFFSDDCSSVPLEPFASANPLFGCQSAVLAIR